MNPVGLLLVDKPEGPTSHDMISRVRAALGVRRVGHTGTLDPFASGLLLLCVGWATRLSEYLTPLPKHYRGVIRLGETTDTDDRTGRTTARSDDWQRLDRAEIEEALRRQQGVIEQRPPVYSARKVSGRRAYDLARKGESPELGARPVEIESLELRELQPPDLAVEIECSSGTYIRAVARDLGESLGVGAHLRELRRLAIGGFRVEDALRLEPGTSATEVLSRLRPVESAVAHLRRADLEPTHSGSHAAARAAGELGGRRCQGAGSGVRGWSAGGDRGTGGGGSVATEGLPRRVELAVVRG